MPYNVGPTWDLWVGGAGGTVHPYAVQPWTGWVVNGTGTTTTTDYAWYQWSQTIYQYYSHYTRQLTDTERAAHQARRAETRRLAAEADAAQETARRTATATLEAHLTDYQVRELRTHRRFHVVGSRGRCYRIHARGHSGNVELLRPDGTVQARLCAHPRRPMPDPDHWLAQALELMTDEDHFLTVANVHAGQLPAPA